MSERINERMNVWKNNSMNERMIEWKDEWMNIPLPGNLWVQYLE